MTKCSIEGCRRPVKARTWCGTHYQRWLTTGTTDDSIRLTNEQRYLSKIAPPDENGCRLWTDAPSKDGYGKFTYMVAPRRQKTVRAHRWGYEHFVGSIPDRLVVCHSCDVPLCQTWDHWWLGTSAENTADRVAKNRTAPLVGELNSQAKISEDDVREIRRLYSMGNVSYTAIGRIYGLHSGSVGDICRRVNWSHVI